MGGGGAARWGQGLGRGREALLDGAVSGPGERGPLPGVRLHRRPAGWLDAVSRAGGLHGQIHEVPRLNAEMAVADAARFTTYLSGLLGDMRRALL